MKPSPQSLPQARLSRWVALLAITALGIYLCYQILEPFLQVIILGTVLVMVFSPVHDWFKRRTRRDSLSALLSTITTVLVIIVPVLLVTTVLVGQLPAAVDTVQSGVEGLRGKWDVANAEGGWVSDLRHSLGLEDFFQEQKIKEYTNTLSNVLVKQTFTVVGGFVGLLLNFVFLIFSLYFLFRDRDKLAAKWPEMLPLDSEQSTALATRTREVIHACVYGVIFVATVQGFLGGVTFWLLGLPSPVVWGVIMTLLCTLPIVGAWLVWLPAAIGLAVHGDYTKAIILVVVGQFVISSIDGLIRPIVVGQRAKLHELLIFFSVLGGLRYFGILGILIGPVVMAITVVLLNALWRGQKGKPPSSSAQDPPGPVEVR